LSELTHRASASAPATPAFTLGQVLPWLICAALLTVVALYFVGAEEGVFGLLAGNAVHEWTHDGRHLLGFPCH
jgi:cobalt transporter subunit CbtB